MIINHNMNALNAHRMMTGNTSTAGKSMEKLSSGLRINRAGDDAAGLAISEKMRGQIRGLDQASRNSQDGISMIQTAEGALNETHSILQRMRELATQASNDTLNESDRGQIQKEVGQLTEEIDRIANTTEFNTKKLLEGSLSGKVAGKNEILQGQANMTSSITNDAKIVAVIGKFDDGLEGTHQITLKQSHGSVESTVGKTLTSTTKLSELGITNLGAFTVNGDETTATAVSVTSTGKALTTESTIGDLMDAINNTAGTNAKAELVDGKLQITSTVGDKDVELKDAGGSDIINQIFGAATKTSTNAEAANVDIQDIFTSADGKTTTTKTYHGAYVLAKGNDITFNGITLKDDGTNDKVLNKSITVESLAHRNAVAEKSTDSSLTYQIGANEGQTMKVDINNMDAFALNIKDGAGNAIDVTTAEKASRAITTINNAVEAVSTERSKLGAFQNRLEHTIANLGTSSENLTAAESRVRDVDMAKEMMTFSKNNILSQAAQAMLAQANQQPQGVLQLLR
ncbi:flagellin [Clostridium tetanomorphum]|uniref:Flagellin n=1 Tax=Clostridium tetanomorphum TaxID=1553 RepID=A0A923J3E3_CLOTT|nr:flagellin [Clostridium tetanomorphum]MBC2400045.1 flagellin [Clostridium tetanomorphum]NRZ98345.1 flagellin [Clostridium tetanomorphum]